MRPGASEEAARAGEAPAASLRRTRLFLGMARTIARHQMVQPRDRVLVGLSGGPDSSALLHALRLFAPRMGLELAAAHVHHHIRGRSADRDARLSEEYAARLGVPFHLVHVDAPAHARSERVSLETAARTLRLEALQRLAAEHGYRRVALGHTADDQAETVLMWVLRGTSPAGLGGIPPVRGMFVRPLLDVWREDVEAYCRAAGIEPTRDETNLSPDMARNRIRAELLPLIESRIRPGARRALVRLARLAREDEAWMQQQAQEAWDALRPVRAEGRLIIDRRALAALPAPLARRILVRAFEEVSGGHRGQLSLRHVEALQQAVARGRGGAVVVLPERVRGVVEQGELRLQSL
ncbi:tRNA lysidine(34) synthetase TilS [Carboxydochorda subterranea]|uniref:tRNA(Ile)-lysidine synthase n=1 Tax=Carboxydichorda subterranea TaxID=3109565 RepID=A0ABZ1BWX6_9FIRM|nr:tRNA lysidine(34) synthetase TilS [Limnochorda sp. L945t]WRP16985.1 tRNA lysidine(34) synthetase TilS [Limnochorda sp. L945t]